MKFILYIASLLFTYNNGVAQLTQSVHVAGTKCSIIPPEGFEKASNFNGFQHAESGSSIMVTELPTAYQNLASGLTASALQSSGMTLLNKQRVIIQQDTAWLLYISQPANGQIYLKQMLIFGKENYTVMVNGIYPETSKHLEDNIIQSVLSTTYNELEEANGLDAVPFSVDISGTEFKYTNNIAGTIMYSVDGNIVTDKPSFLVGSSISQVHILDTKKFTENRLKSLPGSETAVIQSIKEISIHNIQGYETIASTANETTFLTMLYPSESTYYIIVGRTKQETEKYVAMFRKIAASFKVK